MCYVGYFGELTKLYAYSVMCYVFQVPVIIAGRRRHDKYTLMVEMFLDSGVFDLYLCYVKTIDTRFWKIVIGVFLLN